MIDEVGEVLCTCRDALAAERIADALNKTEPTGPPWPDNLLVRPGRLAGARIEWPSGSLRDEVSGPDATDSRGPEPTVDDT